MAARRPRLITSASLIDQLIAGTANAFEHDDLATTLGGVDWKAVRFRFSHDDVAPRHTTAQAALPADTS